MVSNLYLSFLLPATFGFTENLLIQLEDCCKYKDQGIIFIVDRNNSEYIKLEKRNFNTFHALGISLFASFQNARNSIIVASKSVVSEVVRVCESLNDKTLQKFYFGWDVKKLKIFMF